MPLPAGGLTPVGAESPEGAVEGMAQAIVDLDLKSMIARLSPDEFGALQEYAELFLGDAEADLEAARQEFDLSIDDLQLRSETDGDDGTVFVDGFAVTATSDGETITFAVDGECVEISGDIASADLEGTPFADGPVCADQLTEFSEELFDPELYGTAPDENPFAAFEGFPPLNEVPEVGIAVHRVDGEWYVAPLESVLDAAIAGLRAIDRSHLDAAVDIVEGFINSFSAGFDESFSVDEGIALEDDFGQSDPPLEAPDPLLPSPSTTLLPGQDGGIENRQPPGPIDYDAVVEGIRAVGGDDVFVDCMLAELEFAPPYVLWELGDSFVNDYEPSTQTQAYFFDAYELCI